MHHPMPLSCTDPSSVTAVWGNYHRCVYDQVERHRQAAAAAREAVAAKEQQIKELSKDGAKADKDR